MATLDLSLSYLLRSRVDDLFLTAPDEGMGPQLRVYPRRPPSPAAAAQRFRLHALADGYQLRCERGDLALTLSAEKAAAPVVLGPPAARPEQGWQIESAGAAAASGALVLRCRGLLLDVQWGDKRPGGRVIAYPLNQKQGVPNQHWDLVPALATDKPCVVIAHVQFKGQVKRSQSDEYVELRNTGTGSADLSGYRINAGDSGQDFVFPPGTVLQSNQGLRVYTNQVHKESGGFSFGSGRALWNDDGDEALLYDPAGALVHRYGYGSKA